MTIRSLAGALAAGALLGWAGVAAGASLPQQVVSEAKTFRDCLDAKNRGTPHCTSELQAAKKQICATACNRLACSKEPAFAGVCVAMCPQNTIRHCAEAAGIDPKDTAGMQSRIGRMGEDEFCTAYVFGFQYPVAERYTCGGP